VQKEDRPSFIQMEDWINAVVELGESWRTSLAGKESEPFGLDAYSRHGAIYHGKTNPDVRALSVLLRISDVREAREVKHRNELTKAKAWIRTHSPLDKYVGLLVLSPEKFESLRILSS